MIFDLSKALSTLDKFFLIPCAFTIANSIVKAHRIKKNLANVERALHKNFLLINYSIWSINSVYSTVYY